eukprot:SRR837773.117.p3 GENE.SRR837773.117~~SRR837773.117.p3  ORF type:complete len:175 (+),score=70.29 SRR837773.117:359-883(+)
MPTDQLRVIFEVLGSPSQEDLQGLDSAQAKPFLHMLPREPGIGVQALFGALDAEGAILLEAMLRFNPTKRPTVQQALSYEYFTNVRHRGYEPRAERKLRLDFDAEGPDEWDDARLRSLLIREVRRFHPEVPERWEHPDAPARPELTNALLQERLVAKAEKLHIPLKAHLTPRRR